MVMAVVVALGGVMSSGCTVGPRYAVPPVVTPPAYKEARRLAGSAGGATGAAIEGRRRVAAGESAR